MNKQREAMQFALETLEDIFGKKKIDVTAINMLREALYEPARKPLTDEEIADLWDGHVVPVFGKNGINPIVFARAIERAHGIGEV